MKTNSWKAALLGVFICMAASTGAFAQKKGVSFKVGSDFVSSYIWRGGFNANASVQPTLALQAGGFSLTAWGSVDLTGYDYKEADLTAAYSVAGFTVSLADYYWTPSSDRYTRRYFCFDAASPHIVEIGAAYTLPFEKFPLSVSWNTMLFGADRKDNGKQNYSTYVELAYPFTVKTVDLTAAVGFTPWASKNTYKTTGFAVCNVTFGASKTFRISDGFSLPIFTRLIWNPAQDDVNFVGGFSILFQD